ncbi:MAG: lysine biosynthesis protein LysW [Cenarchaeum sp. SB0665_bin_23]|nr:lysine biosynthesis protein LysW [Cenarchaeum sp. SB0665_bin_23]MYB46329.1 lysine biosynthesis protein LysW [Cenarchaeum sp. SB0662_bin_33]MYG33213.1 lysine biosynthesis protein LysW [Cenarchaeum sp. SB0677_bin_16]
MLCLECDAVLPIPVDSMQGEIVSCPDCGQSYELQNSDGTLSLKVAETIGEDWGQ